MRVTKALVRRVTPAKACALSNIQKFEARYIPEPMSGCWIWIGGMDGNIEYGRFYVDGKQTEAHRWSLEYFKGKKVRAGLDVHHKCNFTWCVNWHHLAQCLPATNQRYRRRNRCKVHGCFYSKMSGRRRCRKCRNESQKRSRDRKRRTV